MAEQATQPEGSKVTIEVWADLGCPWCYVAKHRLQTAITQRPDADRFEIVMRSFQLDPGAPQEPEKNEESYIRTHGGTAADLLRAERQMQTIARKEGLEYTPDRLNANTFALHRVVQYANDQGRGFEFFSKVQDGFFTGTLNPHDPDALAGLAESVGLDGRRVHEILASDEYADRVHADRNEALELGANGVPFVVLDRRVGAPGAQKVPAYAQLLEQVAGNENATGEVPDATQR
ncbi:putative DsbA family dithiol-disulfide isomerase [Haloactinopolyspora alba]|uniref:Putative DsbA family dithiol-disulfide isomerase n=1 Tax=Haloactinopolyspora alba TaxID=648780 RepID=A0A2P8DJ32_9ACTN|nr:DsbA family oxidoreductase [Haloactinopolyspora alba]PSK97230.1 putative DsbA family dithiol-disulfide isomerase [Haloactinopolyspora alba]